MIKLSPITVTEPAVPNHSFRDHKWYQKAKALNIYLEKFILLLSVSDFGNIIFSGAPQPLKVDFIKSFKMVFEIPTYSGVYFFGV